MKIENIEEVDEGVESSQQEEEEDSIPVLPNTETDETKVEVGSIREPPEPESHPRLVPYFKVVSPVPTLSVSSLKGESPYSDREGQTLTSDEDDKEFADPLNNSVESNSTKSMDTSTQRYVYIQYFGYAH